MRAVIAAAGRGKRLMPLTAETPKPLIPIQGTRLLEYILRGLRWAGILEAIIVVRHLGDKIKEAYGSGSELGMKLEYVWQAGPDGTGSAVLAAEALVGEELFMLVWGDVLMDPENYRRIQAVYSARPCDLLSGLNWLDDPSTGAAVYVDEDRIADIEEKPRAGRARTHWNQAGLFVCTKEVPAALRECGLSLRDEIEFTSAVQNLISSGRDVRWMPVEGFWSDVGTPEALARLNAESAVKDLLR
ncbi:MAG TPA: sugar phosphate nucleotidyltransferase [Armatimonadota bacterium]|nr:sugar phosphate nucleotidyltransferase [Armatimonadota bacterium]